MLEARFLGWFRWIGQDFGKLEINQAEAALAWIVGDIAAFGIEVSDAVFVLKFGKELLGSLLRKVGCRLAA